MYRICIPVALSCTSSLSVIDLVVVTTSSKRRVLFQPYKIITNKIKYHLLPFFGTVKIQETAKYLIGSSNKPPQ